MQGDVEEKEVSILYDTRIVCFQVPLSISLFPSVSLPLGPVFPNLMHRAGKRRKAPSESMLMHTLHCIAMHIASCQLDSTQSTQLD